MSFIRKYPKFTFLFATILLAYLFFNDSHFAWLRNFLPSLGYPGIFITGMLYDYGFTAIPAAAILIIFSKLPNIVVAGFIGGLGAFLADLIIFKFIRISFNDEVKKLSKEKFIRKLNRAISKRIKKYLLPAAACFIMASPLPDEIGVTMLAATTKLSAKQFAVITYVVDTLGVFAVLLIGKAFF